jgi:RNA polymerase sigma factor for flagellar operon FliA
MASPVEAAYEKADDREAVIRGLVTENLPLVKHIVSRVCASFDPSVPREDLISAGCLGLVQAAHRFRPSEGTKFATFAYRRVKGAVVDCLRQHDVLGKSAREQLSTLRHLIDEFREEHGRRPGIDDLARIAGISEAEVLRYLSYEKWDYVGSLDDSVSTQDGLDNPLGDLISSDARTPLECLEAEERRERLAGAIQGLPEREQQIIVMYYYEGLYMAEMAEIMGVSESRISQLHTRALYNLTRKLEGA